MIESLLEQYEVRINTVAELNRIRQARTHRRRRINKKWLKRFGVIRDHQRIPFEVAELDKLKRRGIIQGDGWQYRLDVRAIPRAANMTYRIAPEVRWSESPSEFLNVETVTIDLPRAGYATFFDPVHYDDVLTMARDAVFQHLKAGLQSQLDTRERAKNV